uniref:Uncharacterized protein K02A2.6 n=1 Tax=Lygus hesperus TaxID=30085 RepID=A0A0A9XHH6_LYGHE
MSRYRRDMQMKYVDGLNRGDVAAVSSEFPPKEILITAQNLDLWVQFTVMTRKRKPDQIQQQDGVWKTKVTIEGQDMWVPLMPHSLRNWLLQRCHGYTWSGHPGAEATEERVRKLGMWPELSEDVCNYIKECRACSMPARQMDTPRRTTPTPKNSQPTNQEPSRKSRDVGTSTEEFIPAASSTPYPPHTSPQQVDAPRYSLRPRPERVNQARLHAGK